MGIEKLTLDDISKMKRPTLGSEVSVVIFRLLRLIGMYKILGESAGHTLYIVGKDIGADLPVNTVDEFLNLIKGLKIGIPKILESSEDRIVVFVEECITCSGLPNIGIMTCHLESGIIAGALEKILKRPARSVQTKSNASGFNGCEFEISLF